jgi:hypothetical protein
VTLIDDRWKQYLTDVPNRKEHYVKEKEQEYPDSNICSRFVDCSAVKFVGGRILNLQLRFL